MENKRVVTVARGKIATTKLVIEVADDYTMVVTPAEAREVACKILELLLVEAGGKVPDTAPALYAVG